MKTQISGFFHPLCKRDDVTLPSPRQDHRRPHLSLGHPSLAEPALMCSPQGPQAAKKLLQGQKPLQEGE